MSKCNLVYQGMRVKHQCSREAEFEVYDFKTRRAVPCCLKHVGLVIKDIGRSCLVKPLCEELADRSPDDA